MPASHPLDRKFYNTRDWRDRLRPQQLAREPKCQDCFERGFIVEATQVDHRIPANGDPVLQRDPDNFRSLCNSCHSAKTNTQSGKGGRPAIGVDGWPVSEVPPRPIRTPKHRRRRVY